MDVRQMQAINQGVNTGKMQILHRPTNIQTDTPIDMNMEDPTNDDIDAEVMMDSDLQNENDDKDEDDNDVNDDEEEEGNDDEMNDDTPTIDTVVTQQQLPPTLQQPPQLHYPYQCCMEITLPIHHQNISKSHSQQQQRNTNHDTRRNNMAKDLQRILQVDPELTKQTYKVITTRCSSNNDDDNNSDGNSNHIDDVLVVHFYATQCKGLRVSISSFLEYIQVALKCYQEFT